MPFNGSGTFTRTNGVNTGSGAWADDAAAGTRILASRHDTHDQDIAAGLTNCITKDGQTIPTAHLPMGGYRHTNVASATARTNYAAAAQMQDGGLTYAGASTGSSNAYVVTLTPAITAYVAGQSFTFLPNHSNTGAATVNVNGVGSKTIQYLGKALVSGEILANVPATIVYDGTQFQLVNHAGGWGTYTPTIGGIAPMGLGSIAILHAAYQRHGSLVIVQVAAEGTTSVTESPTISCTLPIAANGIYQQFSCRTHNAAGTSAHESGVAYLNDTSTVYIQRYNGANFTLGIEREFAFGGVYRTA